jgi:Aldo/keto reductase family
MKTVELPSGERVPALGLGTWHMAERAVARGEEIAALQHDIDQGASLIDTAEMYADGGAERLVGEAIGGGARRSFWSARSIRTMPVARARSRPANGAFGACRRRARSATGASATSTAPTCRNCSARPRETGAPSIRCSTTCRRGASNGTWSRSAAVAAFQGALDRLFEPPPGPEPLAML